MIGKNPWLKSAPPHVFVTKDLSHDEAQWQSAPDGVNTAIEWSVAQGDDFGCFSSGTPTRLTVPKGVTDIRLVASVAVKFLGPTPTLQVWSQMNGGTMEGGRLHAHLGYLSATLPAGDYRGVSPAINVSGPILPVSPGDYFEIMLYQSGGGEKVRVKSRLSTYFAMELFVEEQT